MNLLINEPPLQVLPSLAKKVGLNQALFLQQLHFRLLISTNLMDGHKWIYRTYEEWKNEFPFWSTSTIRRTIEILEKDGYIISTSKFNKMKMDNTKWYRIDYSKIGYYQSAQNEQTDCSKWADMSAQNEQSSLLKMSKAIPKDIKSIKKNNIELALDDVSEILNYLNSVANKNFKTNTKSTQRLIKARLSEGFTVEDCKRVIDVKTKQWLTDPVMNKYLRPDTLFNASKFEGYLNENTTPRKSENNISNAPIPKPLELNFNAGEDF